MPVDPEARAERYERARSNLRRLIAGEPIDSNLRSPS